MISIKLSMNGVVRRAALNKDTMHFQEINNVARRLYPELANHERINLSWIDNEGDNILVSSEEEFDEAVRVILSIIAPHNGITNQCLKFMITPYENNRNKQGSFSDSKESETAVHSNVSCDECHVYPIVGIRYKCTTRENFDLCSNCEAKRKQPFPMIKIYDASHKWKDSARTRFQQQKPFHCKSIPKSFNCAGSNGYYSKCGTDNCGADVLPEIITVALGELVESIESRKEGFTASRSEDSAPSSQSLEDCIAESINSIITSIFSSGQDEDSVKMGRNETTPIPPTSSNKSTGNDPKRNGAQPTGSLGTCSDPMSCGTNVSHPGTSNAAAGLTDLDIWQPELQMLEEMGFYEKEEIIPLLRRFADPPLSQRRQQLQDRYGSPDAALINMNGIHRVVNELFSR